MVLHSQLTSHMREKQVVARPLLRFSIIVSTYNRCNQVLSTLASLRCQTLPYEHFEVIVVDCGSVDGTMSAIQTYVNSCMMLRHGTCSWQVRSLSEQGATRIHAHRRGLQVAAGDVLVFLDDDTLVDPCFLERLMTAYEETGAMALSGRVLLHCELPRPTWLTDDLLAILGYFAPGNTRMVLPPSLGFSSCCFSVKAQVLRDIGGLPVLPEHTMYMPASTEVEQLCRYLRAGGHKLWYEPAAIVTRCVAVARLRHGYFTRCAFWRGRAEVLLNYIAVAHQEHYRSSLDALRSAFKATLQALLTLARTALFHYSWLYIIGQPTNEQVTAQMRLADTWGRALQMMLLLQHEPATITPTVLLVHNGESDGTLLAQSFRALHVRCREAINVFPITWLWRYRAIYRHPFAVLHLYRPGALRLNPWQRQRFLLLLWLAQYLGIRIVATDAGGWWQNMHHLSFLERRTFEHAIFYHSDLLFSYASQPEQVYADKLLRRRVRYVHHPGLRGRYPEPVERSQAYAQLGIPLQSCFVYLCFSAMHTEREILHLIEAFLEMSVIFHHQASSWSPSPLQQRAAPPWPATPLPATVPRLNNSLQLLLVGTPCDKKIPTQLLQRAGSIPTIHFLLEHREQDMALYLGAAHTIAIPHFPSPTAGNLAAAMLALSYERVVVAPDLPRFRGLLPSDATILYDPSSRTSLAQALYTAPARSYRLTEEGIRALDARKGWQQHAQRLLIHYQQLLLS